SAHRAPRRPCVSSRLPPPCCGWCGTVQPVRDERKALVALRGGGGGGGGGGRGGQGGGRVGEHRHPALGGGQRDRRGGPQSRQEAAGTVDVAPHPRADVSGLVGTDRLGVPPEQRGVVGRVVVGLAPVAAGSAPEPVRVGVVLDHAAGVVERRERRCR